MYLDIIKKYRIHHALGGDAHFDMIEQNAEELNLFCKFLEKKRIKTILEIGTQWGKLKEFLTVEMGIKVESIDVKDAPFVDYVGKSSLKRIRDKIGKFDLVFVDGDHTYPGVKSDYKNYKSKCDWMAFHDILGLRDCEGVKKLWGEVILKHESREYIAKNIKEASGIGIIKC